MFTDFHTPDPTPSKSNPIATVTSPAHIEDASGRRTTLTAKIGSGEVIGTGFTGGEEIAVAVVIYRLQATADGTIELNLPVALLERHRADVVLVGATSGSVNVTPAEASTPVREAS